MPEDHDAIPGSKRTLLRGSKRSEAVDPAQRIEVSMRLRPRQADPEWESHLIELGSKPPGERTYFTTAQLAARRGADPADIAMIKAFARAHHLTVIETSIPRRTVRLAGTAAALSAAFHVQLHIYQAKNLKYRGRSGQVYVPRELSGIVEGVFGLDNRPIKHASGRLRAVGGKSVAGRARKKGHNRTAKASAALEITEVAKIYDFPKLDGAGQRVALIELNSLDSQGDVAGAGYSVADLDTFFRRIETPRPKVTAIGINGGGNKPGSDQLSDSEVTVDIEVVGAIAPKADIDVYFAPDTDAGFIDAVSAALYHPKRKPSVISISWGNPEENATLQFLKGLNEVITDAAALGVTVCCETGDFGSSDQAAQTRDGKPHVEFPASSPFALACGGTKLAVSGTHKRSEMAWNEGDNGGAGGGGISNRFPRPQYQAATRMPLSPHGTAGRGLPDVAANAVGYNTFVKGHDLPATGTSVVAPLWAGLLALVNQSLAAKGGNTVGFINPLIYNSPAVQKALTDVTKGSNDIDGKLKKYASRPGWDPCTGMGTPNGFALVRALAPDKRLAKTNLQDKHSKPRHRSHTKK